MAAGVSGNFAQVNAALAAVALRVEAAGEPVEQAGAEIVRALAAAYAPRLTGKMAASIDADGGSVSVDDPGGYQEYGTRHHAAQPFLRPAKDAAEGPFKQAAEAIYTAATR